MNYPNELPAITLDFQNSKQLDPRITLSRASEATFIDKGRIVGAAQNVPRLDDRGLLIEESRTNHVPDSSSFSTDWDASIGSSNRAINAGTATAPTGTDVGFHLGCSVGANAQTWCYFSYGYFLLPSTGTYTVSVFVKQTPGVDNNIQNFLLSHNSDMATWCCWDWETTDYDQVSKDNLDLLTPEYYGDGWWRIGAYVNLTDASVSGYAAIGLGDTVSAIAGNRTKPNRANTNGGYFYGFQLEKGSSISSFIPSPPGSTATRAADICQINSFDWHNPTQATWVTTAGTDVDPGFDWSRIIYMVTSNAGLWIDARGYQSYKAFNYAQAVTSDYARPGTKGAFAYAEKNIRAAQDGAFAPLDTTTTGVDMGTVTSITLGSDQGVNKFLNGYIGRISFYPTRLPDAALEALST